MSKNQPYKYFVFKNVLLKLVTQKIAKLLPNEKLQDKKTPSIYLNFEKEKFEI